MDSVDTALRGAPCPMPCAPCPVSCALCLLGPAPSLPCGDGQQLARRVDDCDAAVQGGVEQIVPALKQAQVRGKEGGGMREGGR